MFHYEEEYPEIGSVKEATATEAALSTCNEPYPPATPVLKPSAPPKKITPAPDVNRRKRRRPKSSRAEETDWWKKKNDQKIMLERRLKLHQLSEEYLKIGCGPAAGPMSKINWFLLVLICSL